MYYLGFDVGGSSVKAVLVKERKIIKSIIENLPTDLVGLLVLVEKVIGELTAGLAQNEIKGIGFGLAGALDAEREKTLNSPNISYLNNQPIKRLLTEKLAPWPIKIEHDVHCFLLAETKFGLAQNLKNVFYLTLGTGIGGALLINGRIFAGAHGAAGEVGHMVIDLSNQLDWEELTANKFVKKMIGVSGDEAEKLARSGDQKAKELFDERGRNLGIGIANIINIFDPEAIIIGGGMVSAREFILEGAQKGIETYVISPAAKQTKILFSELGRMGGAWGAALLFDPAPF